MKTIKNILLALLIYIAIPASLLFTVFQLTDRNSENLEKGFAVISKLLKFQEDEDDEIPLIKAHAKAENDVVVSENFIKKEEPPQMTPPSLQETDVNDISMEFEDQTFNSEDILADKLNRLPRDFKVPENLKDRVGFWFDIYTKYSARFSIIHDQDRPWIVYKIVDSREIYKGRGNIFAKDIKERRAIGNAKEFVKKTLTSLSKKHRYNNLTVDEYKFYKLLEEVPGPRQKVFKTALKNFRVQKGQKNFYMKGLIESNKYINEMEEIFARYDLPIELVRLPLVESSFNEEATSKVGASGVWQFMLDTGKKYLHVSDKRDERISPIKETEAAAKLFMANYKIFKTWPLTITAYNHGTGIFKATKKYKTIDMAEIIKRYDAKSFSFASQNFYCEFLAALYAERYEEEIFGPLVKHPAVAADSIKLRKSMRVREIADIAGVTLEEIKLHNPDIQKLLESRNPYLPLGYTMRLPLGRSARLELYYQQMEDLRAANKKATKKKAS